MDIRSHLLSQWISPYHTQCCTIAIFLSDHIIVIDITPAVRHSQHCVAMPQIWQAPTPYWSTFSAPTLHANSVAPIIFATALVPRYALHYNKYTITDIH
jgi:hypothetical protein